MNSIQLREMRLELGLTQKQLANFIGITVTTVNRWERGVYSISDQNKYKLYNFFKSKITGLKPMKTANIQIFNSDCLTAMKAMKNNEFDLAIVDPPYGINEGKQHMIRQRAQKASHKWQSFNDSKKKNYKISEWDNHRPDKEYFDELKRVSKRQIIWGGNYYADLLEPSGGWIFWDKNNFMPTFSDGELAYVSHTNSIKKFDYLWAGFKKREQVSRFHPTQKPVPLYHYCLYNYAKEGYKILDTHLGSGSSAIACWDMNYDLTAFEIDKDYYEAALIRLDLHKQQLKLF